MQGRFGDDIRDNKRRWNVEQIDMLTIDGFESNFQAGGVYGKYALDGLQVETPGLR